MLSSLLTGGMRMKWTLAVLAVTMTMLAGCGGGSDPGTAATTPKPSTTSTTPTPEPTYSAEQAIAALPTLEQVPGGDRYAVRCPGDDDLCDGLRADSANVAVWITPVDAAVKELAEDFTLDLVQLSVVTRSAADAASAVAKVRKRDEVYDGAYDIPPKKIEGGTSSAEKGTGTVEDVTIGSFTGHRVDRTDEFRLPGGIRTSEYTLRSGGVTLFVQARLAGEGRGKDDAADLARTLLDGYLERLG